MQPKINILIRTHRPLLFERCIKSVELQTYKNINVIIHKTENRTKGYDYNLYCNILKEQVTDGWFMFLDDDDVLNNPKVIERLAWYLLFEDELVIIQMIRNGRPKPSDKLMDERKIERGKIGMPCFVLHSKHKNITNFDNSECADYNFIKRCSELLPVKLIKLPVVSVSGRRRGR